MLHHYYHVFATKAAIPIAREHELALTSAGLLGELSSIVVGIVGTAEARAEVKTVIPWATRFIEAANGWEDLTLQALSDDIRAGLTGKVLYCHTKGAANPDGLREGWRRDMTRRVVNQWRDCVPLLDYVDAVGPYWLAKEEGNDGYPYFSGNFWWATTTWLATLSRPHSAHRFESEVWLGGMGAVPPIVTSLGHGWPSWNKETSNYCVNDTREG